MTLGATDEEVLKPQDHVNLVDDFHFKMKVIDLKSGVKPKVPDNC